MKIRNVAYIARASVPSPSTNSIHIAKISEAFSQITEKTLLIVSGGDENIDYREYYGIRSSFELARIPYSGDKRISQFIWAKKAVDRALASGAGMIVTRDPIVALISVIKKQETVLDLHGDLAHLCGRFYRMMRWKFFISSKKLHLVMISGGLQKYYLKKYGVPISRSTVLPDGCNLDDFSECSGRKLDISKEPLHIGYFGKTVIGKGIDLIRRLALIDPDDIFEIYGGDKDAAEKETKAQFPSNVIFHGHVKNKEIPEKMCEMDVLLLPNQDRMDVMGEDIGKFTSPLKMFEYMASGRVIIASDLPILREILSEENAYLADSQDEQKWYEAITAIKFDGKALKKAERACEQVQSYTWKKRAEAMISLVED